MADAKQALVAQTKRFGPWWLISIAALAGVLILAPQQGTVLLYKLAQVTVGLLLAYFADRALFHHAPDIEAGMPRDMLGAARIVARALVALAIILGLTVGI